MGKMKDNFEKVGELVYKDKSLNGATVELHLCKLGEEFGEFAQVINKTLGIKSLKKGDTPEAIRDNIAEEAADMIQIITGICQLNNISYDELMIKFKEKNEDYQDFINKKRDQNA
jgi:NTP pyrophosphatase (non-canonical NTP hydrolase)